MHSAPHAGPEAAIDRLIRVLERYGSTLVAFSGGVDSALVAKAAHTALGDKAVAVISDSPTLPRRELDQARALAAAIGIRFHAERRSELDDPAFVANATDRCYFCKAGLMDDLAHLAETWGTATISLGVNASDLGDWRPGIDAARTRGGRFPLLEAGLGKQDVRHAARTWRLPVWDKPSAPCLSSRIPYGQPVTLAALGRIERAEDLLKDHGLRDVRVRHLGQTARVEVPDHELARLNELAPILQGPLRALGFQDVLFDPRPLVSGRLNNEPGR